MTRPHLTPLAAVAFTPGPNLPDARATADTGYLAVLRPTGTEWLIAAQSWNADLRIGTPMSVGQ